MPSAASPSESQADWPDLPTVQRWFHAVITHPDGIEAGVASDEAAALVPLPRDALEHLINRSKRVSARDRIAIYASAYYARLIECLGDSFPALKRALGEDVFNGFAFGYLQQYPSRSYTLGRLGNSFARYLDESRPDRDPAMPEVQPPVGWPDALIDLATLEWTIEQVFDGPGVEGGSPLRAEDLQGISPDAWPEVRLVTAPCLRLVRLRFRVNHYYTALRNAEVTDDHETVIAMPEQRASSVAITRRDYVVRRLELTEPQFILLDNLQRGEPVGLALSRAAEASRDDDATLAEQVHRWFADWTRHQMFQGVMTSQGPPSPPGEAASPGPGQSPSQTATR